MEKMIPTKPRYWKTVLGAAAGIGVGLAWSWCRGCLGGQ